MGDMVDVVSNSAGIGQQTKQKKHADIREVDNGFTVSDYGTVCVAKTLEEALSIAKIFLEE